MSICQSCGAHLEDGNIHFGTNADGTQNTDYCDACWHDGRYTEDLTLDQMIMRQTPYIVEASPGLGERQANDMLRSFLPGLKRWHT